MEEKNLFSKPCKIFFFETLFFSLTFLFGLSSAYKINSYLVKKEIKVAPISPLNFLLTFFITTSIVLFLLYFLRFKKGKSIFFKIALAFSFFVGGLLFLYIWIPVLPAAILMTILIFWWLKSPTVFNHNLCLILGMAGIGANLGLKIMPTVGVIILISLSIYDWIAVYKTKHMVKMAREMIEMGVISALIIPQSVSSFKSSLANVKPGGEFLVLGGGDVVLPLIFAVSLIPFGVLKSAIVALFSLIGVTANFFVFVRQKERKPMPALPLISFFSIIGYLITLLLK
jgi:presenilin-like A22 family membrane protease